MTLKNIWEFLSKTKCLSIECGAHQGIGTVFVSFETPQSLLFHESGEWLHEGAQGIKFTNHLRWSVDLQKNRLFLEHLRFGKNFPHLISSFELDNSCIVQSRTPYQCEKDSYLCKIEFSPQNFQILWEIKGPNKNYILKQNYTQRDSKIGFSTQPKPRGWTISTSSALEIRS